MSVRRIVSIRVSRMWESCQRATFYVELTTDEGFTTTPASYATGSVYTDFKGLSEEEARDRALMDAHDWADLLGLTVEPFMVEGKPVEPSIMLARYTTRRFLAERADGALQPRRTDPPQLSELKSNPQETVGLGEEEEIARIIDPAAWMTMRALCEPRGLDVDNPPPGVVFEEGPDEPLRNRQPARDIALAKARRILSALS